MQLPDKIASIISEDPVQRSESNRLKRVVRCVEKMRECKLSKQKKSLSWFAIFTAFSGDKVLSTRGDKFYEGQFLATRKTLTVSGGTLKNAKLNLDKNVPKYNSCIHIPKHTLEMQSCTYLRSYCFCRYVSTCGVWCVEWESPFLESGFMDCAFEYYAKPHPCLSPTLSAKPWR